MGGLVAWCGKLVIRMTYCCVENVKDEEKEEDAAYDEWKSWVDRCKRD